MKRAYKYKCFQYYNFKNQYNDILPHIHLNLNGGNITIGWLWVTLSAFIFPKLKLYKWKHSHRYFTLIDKKLYFLYNIGDISTPRILVTKDCMTFIFGFFEIEYER